MLLSSLVMLAKLLENLLLFLQPESPATTSRQPSEQMVPNGHPQSPDIPSTQLHQRVVSSRQPQTQVMPSLGSVVHQSFTVRNGADQPLISALVSSHHEYIQQQASILSAIQRDRGHAQARLAFIGLQLGHRLQLLPVLYP